jgi:hypothetical protein
MASVGSPHGGIAAPRGPFAERQKHGTQAGGGRKQPVGNKADWAKITFHGRDAHIEGDAPDRIAMDQAVEAPAGTRGVRRVDASQARIVLGSPYDESVPVADNGTDEGRVRSRRIEISIVK